MILLCQLFASDVVIACYWKVNNVYQKIDYVIVHTFFFKDLVFTLYIITNIND